MDKMGVKEFYAANFHDLTGEVTHPIGCQDCHDPQTLKLRITRPALREAFAAMGRDIDQATHQEMRSLVCSQCHVEYYFRTNEQEGLKNYLTFPWAKGTALEEMLAYYDGIEHKDYVHAISGTPIVKAQHPDYELYLTGIHAYRNVSCADCHMPYRTEGGVKFTDHHVQSPLLNIANSCAVCHRWSEEEIRTRVEGIQTKTETAQARGRGRPGEGPLRRRRGRAGGGDAPRISPARESSCGRRSSAGISSRPTTAWASTRPRNPCDCSARRPTWPSRPASRPPGCWPGRA